MGGQRYGPYYVRYRRLKDGRKESRYVGGGRGFGGELGRLAASWDELERLQREEQAAHEQEKRERLQRSAGFLDELEKVAEVLTNAHLIAAGFTKRRGEWRRTRASARV